MCYLVVCLLLLSCFSISEQQQRVAPGVNPQHYQQQQYQQQPPPPPQQQYQQVPAHQQQLPVQQQVPLQHVPVQVQQPQQVPVPVQQPHQVPVHQQHIPHHGGHNPGQILNAANVVQEKEHIAEHFAVPIDTSKMSEQELQFHYFKMHDADNNNKLDGCELVKSLIHWHEQGHKDPASGETQTQEKIFGDEELNGLIDPIFEHDDLNRDGYIDYPEFIQAQQKDSPTEGDGSETEQKDNAMIQTDEDLSGLIDPILNSVDLDQDGFVDWTEFKKQEPPKRHS